MPPTDPRLDERVCRKLGWEPIRIEWTLGKQIIQEGRKQRDPR